MNWMRILGIVLILLGAAALYFKEITYTTKEEVLRVGTMQANMETKKHVPIHPAFGGLAVVGGIALLALGGKKK